jgi:hypothetical protein
MVIVDVATLGGSRLLRGVDYLDDGLRVLDDVPPGALDDVIRTCGSFSADTRVVMADGRTRPISDIVEGDAVLATDPNTGESGPRLVTAVWPHQDLLVELDIDGESVTTTEDHPFWNATDGEWQRARDLEAGDGLLTLAGGLIAVEGLDWETYHFAQAFDLTVSGFHTFYVEDDGGNQILVHNVGCDEFAAELQQQIGGRIHSFVPPAGAPWLGDYALKPASEFWGHHTVVVRDGRVYDQFTGSDGLPIDEWKALWDYGDDIDFGF